MTDSVAPAFVGRTDELRLLRQALSDVRQGSARIIVVEGEAGIGKTALARRFLAEIPDAAVAWASGDDGERSLEYGVVEQLRAALTDHPEPAVPQGTDSLAAGAFLLGQIGTREYGTPLVLIVDDLHWADLASARALLFLLRRLRREQALVVATVRPAEAVRLGDGWARLVADQHRVVRIRLGGLTTKEVQELAAAAGRALPVTAGERLRDHTAGNPLYISALLAELSGAALRQDAAPLPAPHSYSATVLARMARLSAEAQQFVAAAAVLGVRAPLRVVTACAALPDPRAAADEATSAGLLEITATRPEPLVQFAHPLVRAAVYEDLAPARRRTLHRAAAAIAEPAGAWHHRVAAAGGPDPALAGQLREAADQELAVGALPRAAEYLLLAARVEPDPASGDRCLYRAVEYLLIAGDVFGAQVLSEQVRQRPAGPYRRYLLALLNTPSGQLGESVAELQALTEVLSPSDDPDLSGRVYAALSFLCATLNDHQRAIGWAQRALDMVQLSATARQLARGGLAWSYAKTGRIADAVSLLAECAPDHGEPAPFETELLAVRGVLQTWAGEFAAAISDLRAVERWVRLGYPVSDIVQVYAALAEAQFHSGLWTDAVTQVELAVSLGEDLEHRWYLPYAHSVATLIYAARGEDDLAAAHANAARRSAPVGPIAEGLAYAALAEAHLAWGRDDWSAVEDALGPLRGPPASTCGDHPNLTVWRYRLAEACIQQNRPDEGLALLDAAGPPPQGGVAAADRTRLRALGHIRRGDAVTAERLFHAGAAAADPAAVTLDSSTLLLEYGRFLIAVGRPAEAARCLRHARDVLRRLGAKRLTLACDTALLSCGVSAAGPPSEETALSRLTARERVVARLVADGATNREIAEKLYLSVKGVEYHVGNIFAKLAISSRRQLRAQLSGPDGHPPGEN